MGKKLVRGNDGRWVEIGGERVTEREQNGHVPLRELPAAELTLEQRIFVVVYQSGGAVSRRQIAKALSLSSTGWLNEKIEGLVRDGYLTKSVLPYRAHIPAFQYEVRR